MISYSGFNKTISLTDSCGKNVRGELNLSDQFTALCLSTCQAYAENGQVVKVSIREILDVLDTSYRKEKYNISINVY
jgi:hypothetical protein